MNRISTLVPLLSLLLVASCQPRTSTVANSPTPRAASPTPASSAVAASDPAPASAAAAPAASPETAPAAVATTSRDARADELPPAPPPLTEAVTRADWSQALRLAERLSNLLVENRADCAKMATELDKFVSANMAALTAVSRAAQHETAADKSAFEAKFGERQHALMRRSKVAVRGCKDNAGVRAAITRIPSDRARRSDR